MGCLPLLLANVVGIVYLLMSGNATLSLKGLEIDFRYADCFVPRTYPIEPLPDDGQARELVSGVPPVELGLYSEFDPSPHEERFEECMLPSHARDASGHAESIRYYFGGDYFLMERANVFEDEEQAHEFFGYVEDLARNSAANIVLETRAHEIPGAPAYEEIDYPGLGDESRAFRLNYKRQGSDGITQVAFRDLFYVRTGRAVVLVSLRGYDLPPMEELVVCMAEKAVSPAGCLRP